MRALLLGVASAFALAALVIVLNDRNILGRTAGAADPRPRIVLFLGDGMGISTVTAARIERGTRAGLAHPSDGRLRIDEAPVVSLVRTHSADRLVTDSAASATALYTGVRVPNGVVSVRDADSGAGDTLRTILELAEARGLGTGVVTTTRLTHATPACAYAHVPDRDLEEEIAAALLPGRGNRNLGDGIEVVLGGGSRAFLPELPGTDGRRRDGRDLLVELQGKGYRIVQTRDELRNAIDGGAGRVFGAFAPSHLAYVLDRARSAPHEPSLPEMVDAALDVLTQDPDGFFLLVEGGRIDHAHHETNGRRAIEEMIEFDDAVGLVLDRLGEDALVLVTADHDHVMALAGYAEASRGVFSQAGLDRDGIPYTTVLYANGPGGPVPTTLDSPTLTDPDFRERSGVPLSSETHGAPDVPLYLWGPTEQIRSLAGTIDNTEVFSLLRTALEGRR